MILYVLIFTFLDNRRGSKKFYMGANKHSPYFIDSYLFMNTVIIY
jgi:hypothetical protein